MRPCIPKPAYSCHYCCVAFSNILSLRNLWVPQERPREPPGSLLSVKNELLKTTCELLRTTCELLRTKDELLRTENELLRTKDRLPNTKMGPWENEYEPQEHESMYPLGIGPASHRWQRCTLSLDHWCWTPLSAHWRSESIVCMG